MKATFADGTVLAESDSTIVVEGNHYFPPESVKLADFFSDSATHTVCPWKGTASYYNANVNGSTVKDIAWFYPETFDKAKNIQGYVAFYKNKVTIA